MGDPRADQTAVIERETMDWDPIDWDLIYDRIWTLRAERDAAPSMRRQAEISRELEEETRRIARLLWERAFPPRTERRLR